MHQSKEDITTGLLSGTAQVHPAAALDLASRALQSKDVQQYHISLFELGFYRLKSHCHYDTAQVSSGDYSVFQLEILDEQLRQHYKGTHILEVWHKSGERLFQKVLPEELTQWKLNRNVLAFKTASEAHLIFVLFLEERKMTAVRHPFQDLTEIEINYIDGYLIVTQKMAVRFLNLVESDVSTTIAQYQADQSLGGHQVNPPVMDREFSGIIHQEPIVGVVYNHLRHELVFVVCQDKPTLQVQLLYYKLVINRGSEKRQISLAKYEPAAEPRGYKRPVFQKKVDTKLAPSEVMQLHFMTHEQLPVLIVLRKNQSIEVVLNFSETIFAETRLNFARILPSFGGSLVYQFNDGTIGLAPTLEKLGEKLYSSLAEYYRNMFFPPTGSAQYQVHRCLHFYQDSVIVNQTLFLVRDNAILLVDTSSKKTLSVHLPQGGHLGARVLSLHKLRQQSDDPQGFKVTTIKVVAVHQNGHLQVFTPEDINLMTRWGRTEITSTQMSQQREPVISAFQNQNASNYLYMVTTAAGGAQRVFQMMFNTQIIEFSNLKLQKGDQVFSVNSQSRQREQLGIVDAKYLAIYRNDKGNLIKLYQINHTRYEIRDHINSNSVFYFQRDYALIITKQKVFKINIATNSIDEAKLAFPVQMGGSAFIDAQCFYFLSGQPQGKRGTEQASAVLSRLGCADTGMIEAAFLDANKGEAQSAIVDKEEKKAAKAEVLHPSFSFGDAQVKRLDFDEFNSLLTLQLANFAIVQVPLLHRNTLHFLGMAERSFYLCFRRHGELLYALDKQNYISKWSTKTGELLSRTALDKGDYQGFEVDREVYDRDWFPYTLLHKASQDEGTRSFKVVKIDDKGQVVEQLSFQHAGPNADQKQHLYFNGKLDRMIELLISKGGSSSEGAKAVYNEYLIDPSKKGWTFVRELNKSENQVTQFIEWHLKSLYPYSLNLSDFTSVATEQLRLKAADDTFKVVKGGNYVKVLNTQDGIELVLDARTGEVEAFMALQYSFTNTKASFYDKRCGHFFIQEVTSRLQNFYEYVRRQTFLEGRASVKMQTVDVSAKDYLYKYVIEQSFTQLDVMFFRQHLAAASDDTLLRVLRKMAPDHVQRMAHNIFPRDDAIPGFGLSEGNTLLHFLARCPLGFEGVDFLGRLAKKEGFVVPFLGNSDKKTPLDLTVERRDHKQTNSLIKLLKKAPMDHHSRLITHLLPKLVGDMNVPQLEKYFDRRRFQTGVCKGLNLMKIKIAGDHEMRSVPTTLVNDNKAAVEESLTHRKVPEQSVSLEVFDLPLVEDALKPRKQALLSASRGTNEYEIKLVKALAATENSDVFQQKTVRAFVDFMWPIAKSSIIRNVFLPYLAFIAYYFIYLVMLKRLSVVAQSDQAFYAFTSGQFGLFDLFFKAILFLGCFYFLAQDFQQAKSLAANRLVLWSYANALPLLMLSFVVIWDTFFLGSAEDHQNDTLQKSLNSAVAFLVWIRVVHFLKCFTHTSYLLRMAQEILYRIRWLIAFIGISLLSFGFAFFFVEDGAGSPIEGVRQMYHVLLGQYEVAAFENGYQRVLLVIAACFNAFFILTLLIALSYTKSGDNGGVWSNEAYQDKVSLVGLYSYLLEEQAVREPSKAYLLIATVSDGRKREPGAITQIGGVNTDPKIVQAKTLKSIDRRLNALQTKVERTLREVQEKASAPNH